MTHQLLVIWMGVFRCTLSSYIPMHFMLTQTQLWLKRWRVIVITWANADILFWRYNVYIQITRIQLIYISVGPWCFDYPRTYTGHVNVTVTGLPCRRWDNLPTTFAHLHGKLWEFPDTDVHAAENYCRNPDGDIWPWCFTGDQITPFDFCSVEDLVCHPDESISREAAEVSTTSQRHTTTEYASSSSRFFSLTPLMLFSFGLYLRVAMWENIVCKIFGV